MLFFYTAWDEAVGVASEEQRKKRRSSGSLPGLLYRKDSNIYLH